MNDRISMFAESHAAEAEALLKELGRIPAPSHHEEQRASFVRDWFLSAGANEVWIDDAGNVLCKFGCDHFDDITVFMAHMDIVFEDRTPIPMKQEGRILKAPGIGDDTANLVNLMMMTKYLIENQSRQNTGILIAADTCEEGLGNSDGCREIMENYGNRVKAFYSFDAYQGMCMNGAVGSHRYRIEILTEGGHSYRDFGNDNAIAVAADLIRDLYSITVPEEARTTYNVGRIEGGTTVNSIAESAVILYEYRSERESCLEQMKSSFFSVIEKYRSAGKRINVQVLGIRPASCIQDPEGFAEWTANNLRILKNYYPGKIICAPNSSDSNIPLSRGIFANTIGTIRGDLPHTREEWADLDSIPSGIAMACALLEQYMNA
ncbi:MAG: M20/M25/M40 family metallo-hydrolase [Bulleidia sp.]